jgi:hypothetical protein
MALENHILGKQQGSIISLKGESKRTRTVATVTAKRTKPVIANKEVYKQRMEEKKAQAAARRAQRAAEKAKKESLEKSDKTEKKPATKVTKAKEVK